MTYGDFIKVLYDTGLFGKNKARFARALFLAAHTSDQDASEDSVKKWLYGTRNCDTGKYFNDGKVDEKSFIRYLEQATRDPGSWRILQKAFSSQSASELEATDFRVDVETDDPKVFYWSLLNQFQRVFYLPESEREVKDSETAIIENPQRESPNEEIHDLFLKVTSACEVMDIINRKPAILNRDDSARLNAFLDRMDFLVPNTAPCNDPLLSAIRSFIEALRIQVLTLDTNLNSRFSFEDESASINMEDDKDWNENGSRKKNRKKGHRSNLPDLSLDLILESADPVNLAKLAVSEWGNFRDKMNLLFDEISSLQNGS